MNKFNIYIGMAAFALTLSGCADLDTEPEGSYVTEDQKQETINTNPDRAKSGVNGIFSQMKAFMPNATALGAERHNDFGYPSVMMCTDANGFDMVSDYNGYNWSGNDLRYRDRIYTSSECQIVWNTLYQQVYTCNSVIASVDTASTDPTVLFYAAQGFAARAFNYHVLAQLYQFNYKGNEQKPCVPIITESNQTEVATAGCARNTVQEVYDLILSDLNTAISLLEKSGTKRTDHRYISPAVAYGLRARVNLTMQNWSDAASDAYEAIALAAAEDITPLSMSDAAKPGFYDAADWMWGVIVDETDAIVTSGIVNWISHIGSLNYGYASYAGGKQISQKLYAQISSTDVRKGWWTDKDGYSVNLSTEWQEYMIGEGYAPYTNVKFGPDKDVLNQQTNANDIILMRVEEMYLILAEATAMAGNPAEGASLLTSFVSTYRDASYSCSATTAEDVQEAVYLQRRIELWGEGMSWFDIMRLGKDMDRRGAGFAENLVYYIPAGSDILLWRLPEAEIQSNQLISEDDNNPTAELPTAVADTK